MTFERAADGSWAVRSDHEVPEKVHPDIKLSLCAFCARSRRATYADTGSGYRLIPYVPVLGLTCENCGVADGDPYLAYWFGTDE